MVPLPLEHPTKASPVTNASKRLVVNFALSTLNILEAPFRASSQVLTYRPYCGNCASSMGALAIDSLFVYGSLLDRAMRIRILGRDPSIHEAVLPGYERRWARYFYIVAKPDSQVIGAVISALGGDDFERLDRYEDAPTLYTRAVVEVADSAAGAHRCWVYLPTRALID
jgi:gamma-glutamylcyclotransferase (GGCT)/AIG2-like uncharacterized protein YtfP